jgi:hypothetical protein
VRFPIGPNSKEKTNASVETLKSLEINTLYPGHGKQFAMDALTR